MRKIYKTIIGLFCILAIFLSINIPVHALIGYGVLQVKTDGASPKEHQALSMTVDSVASGSSLQAFCIGWTFTFSGSIGSTTIYVPISQIDTNGGSRTYTFPLTNGWQKEYTGIAGGKSIRDLATYKWTYDQIIKNGCTVHADARIQKYRYSNGSYIPMSVYANSKAEVDSNFSEFTAAFKSNTKSDYFNLNLTLAPEPPPTPVVTLTSPNNGITVSQGTTVTFEGTGKGIHHIAGYIDGIYLGQQLNPNEDISKQMTYSTTVILDEARDYTFQIKGRNTESEADPDSVLKLSNIHTVHVVPAEKPVDTSGEGTVSIICINQETNVVLQSKTKNNIAYNTSMTETRPEISGYTFQGSQLAYNGVKGALMPDISETITLTTENKNATLYFYYRSAVPPMEPEKPEPPKTPQYHWWILSAKHTGSDFEQVEDWSKKMPAYTYSKTGTFSPIITDELEAGNEYTYSNTNIFPSLDTVRNSDGTLLIDTTASYANINGQRYDIGKLYSYDSPQGLDYGIYAEVDDNLSFSQYVWNEGQYESLHRDWNKKSKVEWGNALDWGGYQSQTFNGLMSISRICEEGLGKFFSIRMYKNYGNTYAWTGIVPENELYKFPAIKDEKNLNRLVYFTINDSKVLSHASSYRLTLVLYTPDGKYNAVTKTITK